MKQYCRYCAWLVTGNGTYCEMLKKEVSDSYAKGVNHCKAFVLNPMDAYGENLKGYKPRLAKPQKKEIPQEDLF